MHAKKTSIQVSRIRLKEADGERMALARGSKGTGKPARSPEVPGKYGMATDRCAREVPGNWGQEKGL